MTGHDEGTGRPPTVRLGNRTQRLLVLSCALGYVGAVEAAPPIGDSGAPLPAAADATPPQTATDSAEGPAQAEPAPEPTTAGQWYARGIELGNAGEFVGAAAAFLRSYELQPTSEALFNAGLAYQNAGETIPAIETYRRFLAEPERNAELARAANNAIASLLREVGTLKGIRYEPSRPPAELYINGERHELDELPLLITPGPVEIEVVDEAGEGARETYEIASGESLVIDVRALLPAKVEPPSPDIIDDHQPTPEQLEGLRARKLRAKQLRTTTWIGLGLTGAAGISFGTLAGLAARERAAFLDATCYEYDGGACPEGFSIGDPGAHLRAYDRFRLGATVSVAIAGSLAIGTLVVGLVGLELERKLARERARVHLTPTLGGLTLEF